MAFAAADAKTVEPLIGTTTSIFLPAGAGCFLATVIGGQTLSGRPCIYARCGTWLPHAWLRANQMPLSRASNPEEDRMALQIWGWDRFARPVEARAGEEARLRIDHAMETGP